MGSYSKPRKLNIVSFLLLLAVIGGAYSAYQFGPIYYRKWQIKGILSEGANRIYPKRRLQGADAQDFYNQLRQELIDRIRAEGVKDTDITISFTQTEKEIGVQAMYKEVVVHPFVNKITTLYFRPYNSIDLTKTFE